jgi:hypothetical protein
MAMSKARTFSKLLSTPGIAAKDGRVPTELTENLEDVLGHMMTNNTVTGPLTVSYNDATGKLDFDATEAAANATAMSIVFGG